MSENDWNAVPGAAIRILVPDSCTGQHWFSLNIKATYKYSEPPELGGSS